MRLSTVFVAVATTISGACAQELRGNFSEAFKGAMHTEFRDRIYSALLGSACDVVTCALPVYKVSQCLTQLSYNSERSDDGITACFKASQDRGKREVHLCPCYQCYNPNIKEMLADLRTCEGRRVGGNEALANIYLAMTNDEDLSILSGLGLSLASTTTAGSMIAPTAAN
ncbi:hypothetical protein AB1N83_006162 [Pleurotus pulmonarius]